VSTQRSTATPYRPATRIPTEIGDVLILKTTQSYTVYAVGRVSESGQQDFGGEAKPTHLNDYGAAVAPAKALVATGGRIFLRNLDTGAWSEIPH
jgi:hypothetical protein